MQARWLDNTLERIQWLTCEMLQQGIPTFGAVNNNNAEATGAKLLQRPYEELSIRESQPAKCIKGMCNLLCKQSNRIRHSVSDVSKYVYTLCSIRLLEIEQFEAMFYNAEELGDGVFQVE